MSIHPRPHLQFKAELQQRIVAFAPRSILDVGCGKGELLQSSVLQFCKQRVGLEVEARDVAMLRASGVDARLGRAENLPFEDRSFDVVTLEYVAHHLDDLARALEEAARVACEAIVVLDAWYDVSLASQRVALDFDAWSKTIDRRLGMTHNPCPLADDLAAPFRRIGGYRLEHRLRLIHQPISKQEVAAMAAEQIARINSAPDNKAALDQIMTQVEAVGMSEDGSILFTAERIA